MSLLLKQAFVDTLTRSFNTATITSIILSGASLLFVSAIVIWLFTRNKLMSRDGSDFDSLTSATHLLHNSDSLANEKEIDNIVSSYTDNFFGARNNIGEISSKNSIVKRNSNYESMVSSFYTLVTDFYEYGWGQSFHFAQRFRNESFKESILRAEYFLSSNLQLDGSKKVLDIGCGIGGPMRNIARFSGADITGITINEYQVNVCNRYNQQLGLSEQCRSMIGDFQQLHFENDHFDGAFEIEATCHSPDRIQCFKEVLRCLKPGALFAGYEWVVTDNYDANNKEHVMLKEGIEVGNGLPTLVTQQNIMDALQNSGFEIITTFDMHEKLDCEQTIPWYSTLEGGFSMSGFRMSKFGVWCTHILVSTLESCKLAPKGSTKVSALLRATLKDLVEAGRREIFTPSLFFLARKPNVA